MEFVHDKNKVVNFYLTRGSNLLMNFTITFTLLQSWKLVDHCLILYLKNPTVN